MGATLTSVTTLGWHARQIAPFGDRRTSADDKGDWVLTVDLEEGNNDLVFRIGDDQATTKTLRIVYEPES